MESGRLPRVFCWVNLLLCPKNRVKQHRTQKIILCLRATKEYREKLYNQARYYENKAFHFTQEETMGWPLSDLEQAPYIFLTTKPRSLSQQMQKQPYIELPRTTELVPVIHMLLCYLLIKQTLAATKGRATWFSLIRKSGIVYIGWAIYYPFDSVAQEIQALPSPLSDILFKSRIHYQAWDEPANNGIH